MQAFGLATIGRDAEVRFLADGNAVANVSLAFNRRAKGEKLTDWVDASIWGKRAEALAPYLLKGGRVSVTLDDIHIETYQGKNGEGHKLAGTITQIELASAKKDDGAAPAPQQQRQAAAPRPQPKPAPNFSDIDDDIPFAMSLAGHSVDSSSGQFARSKQGRNLGADF